jgi:serine/threonine-protein kinase RsbW
MDELITLDIPAKGEFVVLARLALTGLLRERGFSEDALGDLKLAVTEACTNSIRHAYPSDDGSVGVVRMQFSVAEDRAVLVVQDQGAGFTEDVLCEPSSLDNGTLLPSEGGMGIALIRAVVDDFLLEHPANGGTRLTLTKYCDA